MKKKLENLKLRTSTFGLKNKLGIIVIVCLLIFAGYSGVNATIKLGNDGTYDWSMVDSDKIHTSSGKSFPLTSTGLQDAIWDLNSSYGGTVWVGSNIVTTSTIYGGISDYPVTVDFQSNRVEIGGNFDVFNMTRYFSVKNAFIWVPVTVSFHSTVFLFHTSLSIDHPGTPAISNVMVENTAGYTNGTGIYMNVSSYGADICGTRIEQFKLRYFEYGIRLECHCAGKCVNSNVFDNGWIAYCKYGIAMNVVAGAVGGNIFSNVQMQPDANSKSMIIFDGSANRFRGYLWDTDILPDSKKSVIFKSSASSCTLDDAGTKSESYWVTDNSTTWVGSNYIEGRGYVPTYGSDDNLTLYLPFSEHTGTLAYDVSPYANDGTLHNCNWTYGKAGSALDLSQDGDYVTCSDNLANWNGTRYSKAVTVTCWFNLNSSCNGKNMIISTSIAYDAGMHVMIEDGYIHFWYNPNGTKYDLFNKAYNFTKDKWHFLACVFDNTTGNKEGFILLDDSVACSAFSAFSTATGYTQLDIGRRAGASADCFNGSLDEIRIYDRALSYDECRHQYLSGLHAKRYVQSNNFVVFDTDWHEYMKFPTTNTSTLLIAGQSWFNTVTNELTVYNGTTWVSTTLT